MCSICYFFKIGIMHKVMLLKLYTITPQIGGGGILALRRVGSWYYLIVWARGAVWCLLVKLGIGAGACTCEAGSGGLRLEACEVGIIW